MLEKGIGSIWIEGEISNLARPASGHWYFSLKDERAQLRAAMFKNRNGRVHFQPENGQQVLIRAQVTLYETRGDYQVIVEHMEEAGVGLLMRQFEALKKQLADEGLFASEYKKTLPAQAGHIGIVTSANGAAIHDALSVIRRRSPASLVTVFPTAVQGQQAAPDIIRALALANQYGECDVLLLIRGGGSLEDLWCFNDESVARAISSSATPIVSGIGHEVDFTIADFVADSRAPTPSVAAETVTMDQYELMSHIDLLATRLIRQFNLYVQSSSNRLNNYRQRLLAFHPQRQMESFNQRLQFALLRLQSVESNLLRNKHSHLFVNVDRLTHNNPQTSFQLLAKQLEILCHQLQVSMHNGLNQSRHQFKLQALSLDNLSPLKTLSRGFAAISKQGQVVSSVKQLKTDDKIGIELKDGKKNARIL